jgi:hypothetical protein
MTSVQLLQYPRQKCILDSRESQNWNITCTSERNLFYWLLVLWWICYWHTLCRDNTDVVINSTAYRQRNQGWYGAYAQWSNCMYHPTVHDIFNGCLLDWWVDHGTPTSSIPLSWPSPCLCVTTSDNTLWSKIKGQVPAHHYHNNDELKRAVTETSP